MNNDNIILEYFKNVILFFQEVQWLYNMPVTKILFDGSLNLFPQDWLETFKKLENDQLNNLVAKKEIQSNWPTSLKNFVENCQKLNKLPNLTSSLPSIQLPKAFLKNLSLKKQHEIFYLARLVHDKCVLHNISFIVDIGAGLGYICQLLNHLYGYQVLGLESNLGNVSKAKQRQRLIFPESLLTVKYVHYDIKMDSSRDIKLILEEEFQYFDNICLIGLHACGDLSIYISQIYLELEIARLLILASCCYHKLSLTDNTPMNKNNSENEYFKYFPLSVSLKNVFKMINVDTGEFFRRPFMRLACQETSDRWSRMLEDAHNKHSFYVLARAVLELYGAQNGFSLEKVVRKGTRKSQCANFENYLEDSMNRYVYKKKEGYKLNTIFWNEKLKSEIITLWENNIEKQKSVESYTALQLLLQCTAESLVLCDRLCFLKEHHVEADIIPVMERSLSPRYSALISKK